MDNRKTQCQLGVQLYTVREHTQTADDLARALDRIRDIGYSCVQVSAIGPMDAKDVARALADSGLTCAATHVGWQRFKEDLDAVIEEHLLWRCKHAAVGMLPAEYYLEDGGLEKFLDELAPISQRLAAAGLDFSYHNHHHEFMRYKGKLWLEMLYGTAPAEMLKAEIDTYWIQAGGHDPVTWIRRCVGRQPLLHLKDFRIDVDKENWVQQKMAEIGEGNLDWPAILSAAVEAGVQYCLVEQDDCYGRDPFESLAISYRNLKAMGWLHADYVAKGEVLTGENASK